jgi:cell division protease FtsH
VNLKKILSGPFVWIFVAVTVLLIGSSLVNTSGVKQVDTQVGLAMIADGKADTVKVLDGDQRVDITLTNEDAKYGKKVQFFYVAARGGQVVETVANAQIANGYNDEVPNTPWYLALLGSLIPFIIIGAIFWFLMSGMQGGNSKVMNFGKSRAKLVNKDTPKVTFADVAGVDEAIEELEEIKDFLKSPEKF